MRAVLGAGQQLRQLQAAGGAWMVKGGEIGGEMGGFGGG